MMRGAVRKLDNERGASALLVLLSIACVLTAILVIAVPMYRENRIDQNMTLDYLSVETAREVALVQYLQSGESGLVTYYYDEIHHSVVDRAEIDTIEPYGRTDEEHNRKKQTGAAGIPNLGKDSGGAQLLAVSVYGDKIENIRWTGKKWTALDYELMTARERRALTKAQLREMGVVK